MHQSEVNFILKEYMLLQNYKETSQSIIINGVPKTDQRSGMKTKLVSEDR